MIFLNMICVCVCVFSAIVFFFVKTDVQTAQKGEVTPLIRDNVRLVQLGPRKYVFEAS